MVRVSFICETDSEGLQCWVHRVHNSEVHANIRSIITRSISHTAKCMPTPDRLY